jgi:hypothetical protein
MLGEEADDELSRRLVTGWRAHRMDNSVCSDVRRWLRQPAVSADLTLPIPGLRIHIAICPVCRGALSVLAVQALNLAAAPEDITCQQAGEDLAALIEQEVEDGSAAAIRTYSLAWWHIWNCEVCAETYSSTRCLLAADGLDIAMMPTTGLAGADGG